MEIFAAKATGWLLAACWLAGCWLAAVPGWPLPLASDPTLSHPLARWTRGPKTAPRGSQEGPRSPQEVPKRVRQLTKGPFQGGE